MPDTGGGVSGGNDWLTYVKQGKAFFGGTRQGASVGNFSIVQLFNPVASGVTVLVRQAVTIGEALNDLTIWSDTSARGSLDRNGQNCKFDGSASVAQIRVATVAASVGTSILHFQPLANTAVPIGYDWFALLPAGYGVDMYYNAVNLAMGAFFQWAEY
jgi:hypothetical protein